MAGPPDIPQGVTLHQASRFAEADGLDDAVLAGSFRYRCES
jgi:hypothetical protein